LFIFGPVSPIFDEEPSVQACGFGGLGITAHKQLTRAGDSKVLRQQP
jgi:hypothetical protein